ncbi:hypothetical protein HPB50_003408 [Hyalomma asiaticum]|uniref:Uncharacterized protein n=1 Tax=Hyalomma asiaticum TaxID=266040 RepID=A0ACB7SPN2_HYAAI|nr:hypothetical protein HPB50_003408 [Hyalomma asiaticum]
MEHHTHHNRQRNMFVRRLEVFFRNATSIETLPIRKRHGQARLTDWEAYRKTKVESEDTEITDIESSVTGIKADWERLIREVLAALRAAPDFDAISQGEMIPSFPKALAETTSCYLAARNCLDESPAIFDNRNASDTVGIESDMAETTSIKDHVTMCNFT